MHVKETKAVRRVAAYLCRAANRVDVQYLVSVPNHADRAHTGMDFRMAELIVEGIARRSASSAGIFPLCL